VLGKKLIIQPVIRAKLAEMVSLNEAMVNSKVFYKFLVQNCIPSSSLFPAPSSLSNPFPFLIYN
jgi:hypothetical protein